MSEAVQIALINNLPLIITACGSILTAIIGGFTFWLTWHVKKDTTVLPEIKQSTDGMKDALVEATRLKALKEGEEIGKAKEQEQPTTPSTPIIDGGRRSTDQ